VGAHMKRLVVNVILVFFGTILFAEEKIPKFDAGYV